MQGSAALQGYYTQLSEKDGVQEFPMTIMRTANAAPFVVAKLLTKETATRLAQALKQTQRADIVKMVRMMPNFCN